MCDVLDKVENRGIAKGKIFKCAADSKFARKLTEKL